MGRAAAIGEDHRIAGFALAGAMVCPARDETEARAAWRALPAEVAVVIVTARAASWLGNDLTARPGVLSVVMPA